MSCMSMATILILYIVSVRCDHYFPLKIAESGEFGLKNEYGLPCLLLKFSAHLLNLNLNGSNVATENHFITGIELHIQVPDFTSPKVKLSGNCAGNDTKHNKVMFSASWKKQGRKKRITFYFGTGYVRNLVNQLEELRWKLNIVVYSEFYANQSVKFSSNKVVISAPLKQKFICRDKLNISLSNDHFKDYIMELSPEISAQPYYVKGGYPIYICERTRRRTLAESFENRMTLFSGIVLCVSSVSMMVGYTFRRQSHPTRKKFYRSLD
ncbi:unnamed protein product [Thelazia callipaeda]|uniref:Fgf-3 n=1 Tax=Thelazia callipaeda TaxID=103827 RepID=A0A0N5D5G9_THECL|nr:unnamed protein product [Thelazia callipaeda]